MTVDEVKEICGIPHDNTVLSIIEGLGALYTPLIVIVTIIGFVLIFVGLIRLYRHNKMQHMHRHHSPMATVFYFVSGTSLIGIVSILQAVSATLFKGTSIIDNPILSYSSKLNSEMITGDNNPICSYFKHALSETDMLMQMKWLVFAMLLIIGLISFTRGLLLLINLGEGHGQQASSGTAFVHLFAGIIAVNAQGIFTVLGLLVN
ncbi:hypothetical protein [Facilibium subflavum]|uniref:hypothetical protein n=1 Tax=Facilibium subflavum TaxID=2219058 RepID=UPI000E64DD45|nr:hypothetical protein [Facilibium subflavum]